MTATHVDAALAGMLLVHKPAGVTSHDVVAVVRRKLGLRRVGHTGTLDPLAEGLLIVLVGAATKAQQALQGHPKSYEAVIQLGAQTDTGDAAGHTLRTAPVPALDPGRVRDVFAALEGESLQTPPAYSAVKVRGRPAYWWARRQQPVPLAARSIRIDALTLVDMGVDSLTCRVACSAGTYVRTLAEAIAAQLGTVGHVRRLVRLRIGAWSLDDAKTLAWVQAASAQEVRQALRPVPA